MNNAKFESLPHSRVRLSITVPATDVQMEYRATIKHYMKTVEVKGFRKGHVPENVIRARFVDRVRDDAMERTVSAAVRGALAEKKDDASYQLLQYDQPRLTNEPKYDPEQPLKVEVEFDVFPKFTLPPYEGLRVSIPEVIVEAADIERELGRLQQSHVLYHPRGADEGIADGDAVVVDLHNTAGNRRPDLRFIVGGDDAPPFSAHLVGMKVGEQRELSQNNDSNAGEGAAAADGEGAAADADGEANSAVTATVTAIQRRELPVIDDAFATTVSDKFASLNDLNEGIRGELEAHYRHRLEQIKRTNFLHTVAGQLKIELPRSMVAMEKQHMWEHLLEQYKMTEEQLLKTLANEGRSQQQLFQDWDADTTQRLKETIVLREIQQKEQIKVESSDIDAFVAKRAAESGHDPQALKQIYTENKKMGNVIEQCSEDLLFERLFEKNAFAIDKKLKIDKNA